MFILVQPMYSKQELNADSNYVVYSQLIRAMRHVRPEWHWVVIFPDRESGYKYEDDGFFRLPNVTRVAQRISPRKMANAVTFDGMWYDRLMRTLGFDVVWANLVEIAAQIARAGEGTFEMKGRSVTVAAHNYVVHPSLPYMFEVQQHVAFAQLSGALFADHNVFNSDYCEWMLYDNARRWLNDEAVASIAARSTKIPYGTLEESLTCAPAGNDVPVVAYNHRLQAYKNYQETFDLLNELHQEGVPFRVRYMNNTSENTSKIAGYPFVEVRLCATRADYLAALRGCDLNVTNSQHETFCIAAVESMALGQPLVAPDGVTFPEITGRATTNYPYLFTSRDGQKAMLRKLLTDTEERLRWGRVLSEYVTANYGARLWAQRYAALFERLTDFRVGTPDDVRAWFRRYVEKADGVEIMDFARAVRGEVVNGRAPFSSQSLPLPKLLRLVREEGGSVRMRSGRQYVYAA